jgi:hypothetical protein
VCNKVSTGIEVQASTRRQTEAIRHRHQWPSPVARRELYGAVLDHTVGLSRQPDHWPAGRGTASISGGSAEHAAEFGSQFQVLGTNPSWLKKSSFGLTARTLPSCNPGLRTRLTIPPPLAPWEDRVALQKRHDRKNSEIANSLDQDDDGTKRHYEPLLKWESYGRLSLPA